MSEQETAEQEAFADDLTRLTDTPDADVKRTIATAEDAYEKQQAAKRKGITKTVGDGSFSAARQSLMNVRNALAASRNGATAGIELTDRELLALAKRDLGPGATPTQVKAAAVMAAEYGEHGNLDVALNAAYEYVPQIAEELS